MAKAEGDVSVSAGLPDAFAKQLDKATGVMLESLKERTESRGERGGATKCRTRAHLP
jgi:hypothetical protein